MAIQILTASKSHRHHVMAIVMVYWTLFMELRPFQVSCGMKGWYVDCERIRMCLRLPLHRIDGCRIEWDKRKHVIQTIKKYDTRTCHVLFTTLCIELFSCFYLTINDYCNIKTWNMFKVIKHSCYKLWSKRIEGIVKWMWEEIYASMAPLTCILMLWYLKDGCPLNKGYVKIIYCKLEWRQQL